MHLRYKQAYVIQIVQARFERGNHLPRNQYRRITGVVVYELQPRIDGRRIDFRQDNEFESRIQKRLLYQTEMN